MTDDTTRPIVALFVKPPVAGEAKTRLTPRLGAAGAARLAGAFLEDALTMARSLRGVRLVVAAAGPFSPPWDRAVADLPRWDQGRGHLGARMERVIARGLREGAPWVTVLGADVPGLTVEQVERALALLEEHAAVLSPARDGGYYLVGLRRCPPGVFDEIPWSTAETFARTVERLRGVGLTVGVGPPASDVDDPDDLDRLIEAIGAGRIVAPTTARALRALGLVA